MNTDTPNQASEHAYLDHSGFPLIKNNYIVISGCSGGGKSTLLTELANRGYSIVWEPGRQIVKEQLAIEGDALPWINIAWSLPFIITITLFTLEYLIDSALKFFSIHVHDVGSAFFKCFAVQ